MLCGALPLAEIANTLCLTLSDGIAGLYNLPKLTISWHPTYPSL